MQAQEAISKRHSCREFLPRPLTKDLINKLIDSARLAPTARNVQPWEFIAITDKNILNKIGALADNGPFIKDCAGCLAVLCKETKYYLEDGCAATENILLAATDLGLGSCWVAGDKKPYCDEVMRLLKVPEGFKLVSLVALGYPKSTSLTSTKRALEEVLHWEKF